MKKMIINEEMIRIVNRENQIREVLIRQCTGKDLEEIITLQDRVYEDLINKNSFVRTTREEFIESFENDICIGAFEDEKLKAVSLLLSNRVCPRNLGHFLEYDEQKLKQTVTFDSTFIDKKLRGYSLQQIFIEIRKKTAVSWGASEALVAVSPINTHSLYNLLKGGFAPAGAGILYGGLKRLVLRLKLNEETDNE